MNNTHLLSLLYNTPLAIEHAKFKAIEAAILRRAQGVTLSAEEVAALSKPGRPPAINGGIQVLPLFGTIAPRANLVTEASGGTSAEMFAKAFQLALADPNIGAIVIDADSPGGAVGGVSELSNLIYKSRGAKPIEGVINHEAYSAAYWIITACDTVTITPSGGAGSVGVFAAHVDESKALEMQGLGVEYISEGEFKTEGNPAQPLTDEARTYLKTIVSKYYSMFVGDVARNRGTSVAAVKADYGKGRIVLAQDALAAGMVDRIGTLDETIGRLQKRAKGGGQRTMSMDMRQRRARMAGQL